MAKAANACTFSLSSDEDDDAESRRSPISRKKKAIAGRHRGFPEESDKAAKVDVNVQDKGETQVKVSTPSFVLYTIEIHTEAEKWETPKRYREFQELHKQLHRLCPSGGLPTLPKKQKVSLTANYWDEEFLNERRDALDCYLRAVTFAALARPAVLGATVARFLDPRVVSISKIDR